MRLTSWKIYLGMLVIFISGLVIGSAGTGILLKTRFHRFRQAGVEDKQDRVMKMLNWKLKLNEQQQTRIRPIVGELLQNFSRLHSKVYPEIEVLMDQAVEEINKELTPDQQQKLGKLVQGIQSRWHKK